MSLMLILLQVIVICTVAMVIAVGLFSAPWYVLLGMLGIALLVTRWLMPSELYAIAPLAQANFSTPQHSETENVSEQSANPTVPHLTYRGAHYSADASRCPIEPETPPEMTYRGAHYSKDCPPSTSDQDAAALIQAQVIEAAKQPIMKYRGAPIKH